jgi:hypothetical protein
MEASSTERISQEIAFIFCDRAAIEQIFAIGILG